MPKTQIQVYQDAPGKAPLLRWLDKLERTNKKAWQKCVAAILELQSQGHELRRPLADVLRDGVYELRIQHQRVHYRMLYGFTGKNVALVSHGINKEGKVPARDIDTAFKRIELVKKQPSKFTVTWEDLDDG